LFHLSQTSRSNHSERQLTQTYVPLTPQSCAGDLREESPDRIEEWTNAVCEAITKPPHLSLLLSTPRASPSASSLSTPSPPLTPPFINVVCGVSRELSPISPFERKRRLSDSDLTPPPLPKRLHALPSDSCPYDTPNASPVSDDDWSFRVPTPGQLNSPDTSCVHGGTSNSNEARSIGCADLRSFPGDSEGADETFELMCPSRMPKWEGKSSGEENLNFPVPMPPERKTPQTVCPFVLSDCNALDLHSMSFTCTIFLTLICRSSGFSRSEVGSRASFENPPVVSLTA
jgi:hypothetical protein